LAGILNDRLEARAKGKFHKASSTESKPEKSLSSALCESTDSSATEEHQAM